MTVLRRIFHRPAIRMGSVDNTRIRTTPVRNAGFVSFFSETGCVSPRNSDHHDTRLRRQKRLRWAGYLAVTALSAWVVVESARAISLY